jgi:hypothetical protein
LSVCVLLLMNMLPASLAMFTTSPSKPNNRCKSSPVLGLHLSAKSAVRHLPYVLSKLSGTCLAYNIQFWAKFGNIIILSGFKLAREGSLS